MALIPTGIIKNRNNDMKKIFSLITSAVVLMGVASCTAVNITPDVPNEGNDNQTRTTCQMVFNSEVSGFDNIITKSSDETKASSSTSWKDGDKVYITFYNGTTKVPGEATYTNAGGWSVSFDGTIGNGTGLKCEVRYFVNATFQSSSLVSLNSSSEIYETTNGTYDYTGTQVTITATMTPKTGRIRFTGTASAKIYLTGIESYTTFAPANNSFSTTKAMITATVASNGSTPYIYGMFSDATRNLGLVGSDFAYTRACTSAVLKTGDSGYMAIPSETSHNNWKNGLFVKVGTTEFKMIPVAGASSGFFLIGETEVTDALYAAVSGSSSTSTKPKVGLYYSDWESFITKINYATDLNFYIPSATEWEYAAKGGNKSQNYTYSGSNTPGDVAWFAGNSGGVLHIVKQLAPNELGIYDMSGNAQEWTSSTGSSSSSKKAYGGYYTSSENYVKNTSYSSESTGSYNPAQVTTLRLALICK